MDYKSRNPGNLIWTDRPFNTVGEPEPHDQIYPGFLSEIICERDGTVFLMHYSGLDEANGTSYQLLIEAPRSCHMRQAFEWGDISWLDYWSHKGWLIHFATRFGGGPAHGFYIAPSEIDDFSRKLWTEYDHKGPYLHKEEQLRLGWEYARPGTQDARDAERVYTAFMQRHGHRFVKRAA